MERTLVAVTMAPATGPSGPRGQLNATYAAALESAGLTPLLIAPHLSATTSALVLEASTGLVLTGGVDIDPARYGEPPNGSDMATVSDVRDAQEIGLLRAALERGIPVLAICRGMQIVNVALGGSLIQDIASQVPGACEHRQPGDRGAPTHAVSVKAGTLLENILGTTGIHTNSLHHQAISRPGAGIVVTARASDGVVEAVEVEGRTWAVGVQWHPEEMSGRDAHADRLFAAFARACSDRAARGPSRTGRFS